MPGEHRWVAGLPFSTGSSVLGRMAKTGGTLILTDHALVFDPLVEESRTREWPLSEIAEVAEYGSKPARLRLVLRHGDPVVLAVIPKRTTPMWSDDTSARDEALAAIHAALARG